MRLLGWTGRLSADSGHSLPTLTAGPRLDQGPSQKIKIFHRSKKSNAL
jgi:hypothetical protein